VKSIQARIIQYLDSHRVTQEKFARDTAHGDVFDKGRLGKSTGRLGVDVVEKFLRMFPEANPRWVILGEGEMTITGKNSSDADAYKMFLDYKEAQRNYEQSLKDIINEKERLINEKERLINEKQNIVNEKERTISILLEAKSSPKQLA
jgi:hypothetical protein